MNSYPERNLPREEIIAENSDDLTPLESFSGPSHTYYLLIAPLHTKHPLVISMARSVIWWLSLAINIVPPARLQSLRCLYTPCSPLCPHQRAHAAQARASYPPTGNALFRKQIPESWATFDNVRAADLGHTFYGVPNPRG